MRAYPLEGKPPVVSPNCLLWMIIKRVSVAKRLMRVKPVIHFVLMALMR